MNILVNAAVVAVRQVIVDNMHHIFNVQSAGRNSSSDEDRALCSPECTPESSINTTLRRMGLVSEDLHSILALTLIAIGVN